LTGDTHSDPPPSGERGRADLHLHSTHSDGLFAPELVVQKACEAGLRAIALTDHDSVSGVAETMRIGEAAGLEVVPGIELSTNHGGCDFHILGYFVDHEDPQLLNAVRFLKDERDRRGERIVQKLNDLGVNVTLEDVRRHHTGGTLGRPHVARALEGLGIVGCIEEAFARFLKTGAPAFVEKYRLNTLEGIALLRAAGAATVLAHPGSAEKPELVPEILEAGVDGIEIHHPRNPPEAVERYRAVAEERGLIQTGGSDSHGNPGRDREAGIGEVSVPYEVVERLRAVARRS
jgi:predicted metal-dependent phosphoesterase TrpH